MRWFGTWGGRGPLIEVPDPAFTSRETQAVEFEKNWAVGFRHGGDLVIKSLTYRQNAGREVVAGNGRNLVRMQR